MDCGRAHPETATVTMPRSNARSREEILGFDMFYLPTLITLVLACVHIFRKMSKLRGVFVALWYHSRMNLKQRLSASVDASLLEAAERAVKRGTAASVSAWVNDALQLKLDQERRLDSLATFMAAYEKEHGEISADEIRMATHKARSRAIVVRGPVRKRSR